jgi:hypothetical protein
MGSESLRPADLTQLRLIRALLRRFPELGPLVPADFAGLGGGYDAVLQLIWSVLPLVHAPARELPCVERLLLDLSLDEHRQLDTLPLRFYLCAPAA